MSFGNFLISAAICISIMAWMAGIDHQMDINEQARLNKEYCSLPYPKPIETLCEDL